MKIEKLEAKVKELQEKIKKLKKQKSTRWRAEENRTYWYITGFLDIDWASEHGIVLDNEYYNLHNYFKTEEEAQAVADNIKTHIELMELAEELNTEPIDWKNTEQDKFCLYYEAKSNEIGQSDEWILIFANTVYCTNSAFKDEAIKRIGEERLIKYLKGV